MIAGRLVDRIDARVVIVVAASIGALALASAGLLRELWQLYAFHVVFGLCHGASGLVPVTTVVARWFSVRRALAFSIASTGLSFGGILVAPFVALAVERLGLAGAAPWLGLALFLGIVPVTLIVLRPSPGALGLEPDGVLPTDRGTTRRRSPPSPSPRPSAAATSTPCRWPICSCSAPRSGRIAHFYRLASTRTGVATAALALSVLAGSSTIGRLAGGWIMLKVPVLPFALALMLMQAVGLALLAVAEDRAQILIGTVAFGVTMGNSLMMHPLLLAERFGTRDYGRIYSTSQLITVLGVASCPALIGVLYEAADGYALPFLAATGVTLVGFAVLGLFGSARR